MQTLTQLKSGELVGVNRVKIAENLTTFPSELYALADTLEILDLTGNLLSRLPDDFYKLRKLKILFLSNNQFDHLPPVLGQCKQLEMIGFKANQIQTVAENSLPPKTRWLILTDNRIDALPSSIGRLTRLQKLMLAGNHLKSLPSAMANCTNLQLIRLSANQLTDLPDWLLKLPKLAWLAFAGNPISRCPNPNTFIRKTLPQASLQDLTFSTQLGEGASGHIYQANWKRPQSESSETLENLPNPGTNPILAVKLFKGEVTSDGYPEDELMACVLAGQHPNLVSMLAEINETEKNDLQKPTGLVMQCIPESYFNLGLPPCLKSCTRDNFADDFKLDATQVEKIIHQITDVMAHLHANQLCHGDLYAHNILMDESANVLLTDFGAASPLWSLPPYQQTLIKNIEQRALKHLVEDLESLIRI